MVIKVEYEKKGGGVMSESVGIVVVLLGCTIVGIGVWCALKALSRIFSDDIEDDAIDDVIMYDWMNHHQ